jgi:aspartate/methionine/tyrosine aminotransferase
MATEVDRRRETMISGIERIDGLSAVRPGGGIHLPVVVDTESLPPGTDDEKLVVELLNEYHVACHPGYLYGFQEPATLVLSYLPPQDTISSGLERIRSYLSDLSS